MSKINQFTVHASNVRVDEYSGTTLTGFDMSELVSEIGVQELLDAMDYSDIKEYVAENEAAIESDDYDERTARLS